MSGVREAGLEELPEAARALALAFEDDPVMTYLLPQDASNRRRRMERFYELAVPSLVSHGVLQVTEGVDGVAVWRAPKPQERGPRPSRWAAVRNGLQMLLCLRTAVGRGLAINQTLMPAHIREPHWYLAMLGTKPSHQGQGLGSALLAPTLARCDRDGILAYLESSKEGNIPFYERHGFEVTGELRVPDGPKLWPMLRRPRAAR